MSIQYPKGSMQYVKKQNQTVSKQKKQVDYAHRGMRFEDMINQSNEYYLSRHIAVIHKKPTPIQIVKVDYPRRSAAKITEAFLRKLPLLIIMG